MNTTDFYEYTGQTKPNVKFIEDGHRYILDDAHEMPSVTQILARQNITTDLSKVSKKILDKKAEHGVLVHEEIETFIKTGEKGISDEFQDFLDLVYPLCDVWFAETLIATDRYCGRVDLIGIDEENRTILIVDTKTGQVNENAVAWQTSMYALPIAKDYKLRCIAFDAKPKKQSKLIELKPVDAKTIDELLCADALGVEYNPIQESIGQLLPLLTAYESSIATIQTTIDNLKSMKEAVVEQIKREMERARVMSFDSPNLHITYTAPYTKVTVDSTRLKEEKPEIYEQYSKISQVSSSVRIKVKEAS